MNVSAKFFCVFCVARDFKFAGPTMVAKAGEEANRVAEVLRRYLKFTTYCASLKHAGSKRPHVNW
jgi:hypothetical protein